MELGGRSCAGRRSSRAPPHALSSAKRADIAKNELAAQRSGSEHECAWVPNGHGACLRWPPHANLPKHRPCLVYQKVNHVAWSLIPERAKPPEECLSGKDRL